MTERSDSSVGDGELRRLREANAKLPAGLEDTGRDEELVHGRDVHPTGERADRRHSVPGTLIGNGPRPAAESGEWERVRDGSKSD